MTVSAVFGYGIEKVVTEPLFQYDIGQKLNISGLEVDETTEIHFKSPYSKIAKIATGTLEGSMLTVDIPDEFLENSGNGLVWVCLTDENAVTTIRTISIPIKERAKPDGYVSKGDGTYKKFDEEIAKLNAGFLNCEKTFNLGAVTSVNSLITYKERGTVYTGTIAYQADYSGDFLMFIINSVRYLLTSDGHLWRFNSLTATAPTKLTYTAAEVETITSELATDVSNKITSSDLINFEPSRNLLNLPDYSAEKNGVTIDVKDNKITLTGTSTAYTEFIINLSEVKKLKADNIYTLSLNNLTASNGSVFYIYHLRTDSETSDTKLISLSSAKAAEGDTASYTPTSDITASYVKIAIESDRVTDSAFYVQFELGEKSTEYHSPTIAESVTIKNSYFEKLNAVKMNYIYVSKEFTTADENYGVTKFNTIYDANESIKDNGYYNRYTIIVKAGTYTDLQERYSGISDSGETELKGICTKDYVYYEAENIYSMGSVVIKWDGASGFDTLTRADIVLKCPFHIRPNTHTHIRGFTFDTRNLRYGIHIETGGKGYLSDWKIDNCRFFWGGNPDCTDYATNTNVPVFGCGHSIGEKGVISNCKIVATNCTIGYQNHENKDYSGKNLAVKSGADITIKNCDFGGTKIQCRSIYGKASDTINKLTIDNCINVSNIENLYSGESTEPWWKVTEI